MVDGWMNSRDTQRKYSGVNRMSILRPAMRQGSFTVRITARIFLETGKQ